jgi:hypothetical protein
MTPMFDLRGSRTRKLYLDLIEKCLLNTIYEDPSLHSGVFDPDARARGHDCPRTAHTMIGAMRLHNLRTLTEQVLAERIPGDLIETGVWRGGACILMRAVLKAWHSTNRTVWVADSFSGLPPPNVADYPADTGDVGLLHTIKELAVPLAKVQSNFSKYELLDGQVRFLEGWFRNTLPNAPIKQLALIRLDGDMYESTMVALKSLYQKLSPGGYVIVDDYAAIDACRQATNDFRSALGIFEPIHDVDGVGVYWRKPK